MTAPLPPPDFARRDLEIITLPKGTILARFYTVTRDPIHFDRGRGGRLNAPDGSYGVLYAAQSIRGAFAETFLRRPGYNLIPSDLLQSKARVRLEVTRELKLAKLAGVGLGRIGATAEVTHGGEPYDAPQAWSRAIRFHPSTPDGIAYTARHDDEALCYALYDDPPPCVVEATREIDVDQDWFWDLAEMYSVGLTP